jgi:phage tail sheath protein FI
MAVEDYDEQGLLALQRALVRLCAARGDLFAVLALPEHYTEDDAIAHIAWLKAPKHAIELHSALDSSSDEVQLVFPLGFGERNAFTYAALYHPWMIVREDISTNDLKRVPPDGTACGILALRAIARGAWIAPANELLTGVVALTRPVSPTNWQRLQDAQINLVRQDPRGFLWLSADTLCDEEDADLRPINVRRLLSLLRRLALRLGATYVFEPNSDVFRRLVQRGFEALLDSMFVRGAFAGATPDTSFQVVTDSSLNTPQSVEQGRFIVELRVAPSLPMTFLTLRLVQGATSGTVTEV